MSTVPSAHWAAALHAVADHVVEHQLPFPTEIAQDPASRFGGIALDIRIRYEHLPEWLNSLTVIDESAHLATSEFGDRCCLAFKATLPATGVRVDLVTSYFIDAEVTAS